METNHKNKILDYLKYQIKKIEDNQDIHNQSLQEWEDYFVMEFANWKENQEFGEQS